MVLSINLRRLQNLEELIDINLLTNKELFRKIKSEGFSDAMIAKLINRKESINLIEDNIYSARRELGS